MFSDDEKASNFPEPVVAVARKDLIPGRELLQFLTWTACDESLVDLGKKIKNSFEKGKLVEKSKNRIEKLLSWIEKCQDEGDGYIPIWLIEKHDPPSTWEKTIERLRLILKYEEGELQKFDDWWLSDEYLGEPLVAKTPHKVFLPWYMRQLQNYLVAIGLDKSLATHRIETVYSDLGYESRMIKDLGLMKFGPLKGYSSSEMPHTPLDIWRRFQRIAAFIEFINN